MQLSMPPSRVHYAVIMLWSAWGISAVALLINCFLFQGTGAKAGSLGGIAGLVLQAIAIYYISKGNNVARVFVLVIFLLGTPGVLLVCHLIAAKSLFSVTLTIIGYLLRAIAVFLLFTGDSGNWFKIRSVTK